LEEQGAGDIQIQKMKLFLADFCQKTWPVKIETKSPASSQRMKNRTEDERSAMIKNE
jgi:hypothetical protein